MEATQACPVLGRTACTVGARRGKGSEGLTRGSRCTPNTATTQSSSAGGQRCPKRKRKRITASGGNSDSSESSFESRHQQSRQEVIQPRQQQTKSSQSKRRGHIRDQCPWQVCDYCQGRHHSSAICRMRIADMRQQEAVRQSGQETLLAWQLPLLRHTGAPLTAPHNHSGLPPHLPSQFIMAPDTSTTWRRHTPVNSELTIVLANVRGFHTNIVELTHRAITRKKADIVFVCGTLNDSIPPSYARVRGYSPWIKKDRSIRGGGVAFCYKECVNVQVVRQFSQLLLTLQERWVPHSSHATKSSDQPWFGPACREGSNNKHQAWKAFKRHPTEGNKRRHRAASLRMRHTQEWASEQWKEDLRRKLRSGQVGTKRW
ncbi:hypothetical protein E2C01_029233 [Portunus trituberculatus]|uniref:Uncharacterized protein n=1 Tax=Portunus trituberculatus TaxID=210409 RepID=A0A5B7ERB9_PORTR|nr:hypothetical protein [Portunus trituberculatus]